jgi:N-methylhydantoinase A/oxoprolinase/acetone carboxylase beta subunit
MLDPDRFLDGRRRLSREQAAQSLEKHVAKPLNLGIAEAASSVIEAAAVIIERAIRVALASAGFESEGFSIFCFGGNGGNFASLVAQRLGLESAYVFKLGPVLSAFGSSLSSISHVQEEWPYLCVGDNKDRARLSQVVEGAKQRVLRDLEGEGLEPEKAQFLVEITLADGGRAQRLRAKPEELEDALARAGGSGAAVARRVAIRGVSEMPSFEPSPVVLKQQTPSPFGEREVRGEKAILFEWEQLPAGAAMTGPLVLESGTNTSSIPSGWQVTIDGFCNGVIRPAKGGP